jgi:hypothetical protein
MPQAAEELIAQSLSMSKPADLVSAVQALDGCGHVTSAQVHRVWRELTRDFWYRGSDQLTSAQVLLEEYSKKGQVDPFPLQVPEGVTAMAWGLPQVANRVRTRVKEVAIDATCE